MRRSVAGAGLLLCVALGAGCDSDKPLAVGERNTAVLFKAAGARVPEYRVYNLWEDSEDPDSDGFPDGDGQPDDVDGDGRPDFSVYCHENAPSVSVSNAPWPFAVEIQVLREGEVLPRTVVQSITNPPDFSDPTLRNITNYDTDVEPSSLGALPDVVVSQPDGSCSQNANTTNCVADCAPCNPTPGSDTCPARGLGFCVAEGTCADDPSTECTVHPADDTTCIGFSATALCDCSLLGFGFCCTPDRYDDSPTDLCDAASGNEGKCSQSADYRCRPSCNDMGSPPGTLCNPVNIGRRFRFDSNPRILSGAHRDVLRPTSNFIADLDPNLAPTQNPPGGVCPGEDLGEPGIQGLGQPFSVQLNKGDTLIVEARRFDVPPPGITFTQEPSIDADLFVDGKEINDPTGTETTGTPGGNGAIDFTFTAR